MPSAPPPPPPVSKAASEPPESGWDGWADAERLPSSAVIPAADENAAAAGPPAPPAPPIATAAPAPAAAAPAPAPTPQPTPPRQIPPVNERSSERGRVAVPADSEPEVAKLQPQPSSPDFPPMRRARSSPDLPPLVQTLQMPAVNAPQASTAPIPVKPSVVAAPAPAAAPMPAPTPTPTPTPNPAAVVESLPSEVQEQLFGILRAALDQTVAPLREKQRELEAKLAWLHQENERLKAEARSQPKQPVAAPVGDAAAPLVVPKAPSIAPARGPMASIDITAGVNVDPAPKPSIVVQTSYGPVIAPQTVKRPEIEVALENVGPVDITEFGRGRISAGAVLVVLLLAGVAAAIAAMALSYV